MGKSGIPILAPAEGSQPAKMLNQIYNFFLKEDVETEIKRTLVQLNLTPLMAENTPAGPTGLPPRKGMLLDLVSNLA